MYIAGVMQHVEEAGIHSGDSACSLPPHTLSAGQVAELERQATELALALGVIGLMNVQFAIRGRDLHPGGQSSGEPDRSFRRQGDRRADRENRRSSHGRRTSCRFSLGRRPHQDHVSVKEAVFPFARFPGTDIIFGPEMKSTGEVMGIAPDFRQAFAKSQLGAGIRLPVAGTVFISVKDHDKQAATELARRLVAMGFRAARHGRNRPRSRAPRSERAAHQQGFAGTAALRRRHHQWRGRSGDQHHGGCASNPRQHVHPPLGADEECAALHDHFGRAAAVEAIQALASGHALEVTPLQNYGTRSF